MKTRYLLFFLYSLIGLISACTTDIEKNIIAGFDNLDPKSITVSSEEVIMQGYDETNIALTLTWEEYNIGVENGNYVLPQGSVKSFVEMSPSSEFAPVESIEVKGNTKTFTEAELTSILTRLGYEAWVKVPLYLRIRYSLSGNVDSRYSIPVQIEVSPYGIRLNRMDMLATDKENVLYSIYSPQENGIYSGYVGASSWMNFYVREKNNTLWGSQPNSSAFNLSNDELTMWNMWFPEPAGSYYIIVDTKNKQWEAHYLHDMQLQWSSGSSAMKFKQSENRWSASISTTGPETFSAVAWTWVYNKSNEGGIDGTPIEFKEALTIPDAGNWIVILDMSGENVNMTYVVDENPSVSYEPYLEMIDNNSWDNVKSRLYSFENNGIYKGFYYAAGYEKFYFATPGREIVYGSKPNSLYELDSESSKWDIWMPTEKETFNLYSVSLPDNTWSYTSFNAISVAGEFNSGNTTSDPMVYDKVNKVWTADLDIRKVGWGMQILLDGDWNNLFKSKGNGVLGYMEGDNIMPPGEGKYRLIINLSDMGNLTYRFEEIK